MVRGTLLALKHMGKDNGGKGGAIVNLASMLALQAQEGCPVYAGTKHFVLGFSRSMGKPFYFKKHGVNIMALCPGITDTTMIAKAKDLALPGSGKILAEHLSAVPAQS